MIPNKIILVEVFEVLSKDDGAVLLAGLLVQRTGKETLEIVPYDNGECAGIFDIQINQVSGTVHRNLATIHHLGETNKDEHLFAVSANEEAELLSKAVEQLVNDRPESFELEQVSPVHTSRQVFELHCSV